MEEEEDLLFISEEEAGERLDKALARRFKGQSRSYFQFLIEQSKVLVNGSPVKKRTKLKAGDEAQVFFTLTPEAEIKPEPLPLAIVYEDQDLLVVNKEAGMVVHPAPGHWTGTFVHGLLFHCQSSGDFSFSNAATALRPGIVHRLDKDTSGLLVAAKNTRAQQKLIEMFAARDVYKEYLAICIGNPGSGEISAPIGRHPTRRQMMAIVPEEKGGKPAISLCQTLAFNGKMSFARIVIKTGRTHQIRVHLKQRGSPILGDALYGNKQINEKEGVLRQLLHASVLRFSHPIAKIPLEFYAPLPRDMEEKLKNLKLSA